MNVSLIMMRASQGLEEAQLENEMTCAQTTTQLSDKLKKTYENGNAELKELADKIQSDTKTDEINKDQTEYQYVSQKYQNWENLINSDTQSTETQVGQIATSQQMTIQFCSTVLNLLNYLGNLLQGRLG